MNNTLSYSDFGLNGVSSMMAYEETLIFQQGNKAVVGYLADDSDCQNPLNDNDFMGEFYDLRGFAGRTSNKVLFEALSLGSDGEPCVDTLSKAYDVYLEDLESYKPEYIRDKFQDIVGKDACDEAIEAGLFNSDDLEKLHAHALSESMVGNPGLVMLDVYSHSGESWSVAGTSPNPCRFDTSSNAGFWLPCEGEMTDRIKEFSLFRLLGNRTLNRAEDFLELNPSDERLNDVRKKLGDTVQKPKIADFESVLKLFSEEEKLEKFKEECRDWAESCMETYNEWASGNCFGIVVTTFQDISLDPEESEWEEQDSDTCWGFVGSEHAMLELKPRFDCAVTAISNSESKFSSSYVEKVCLLLKECSSSKKCSEIVAGLGRFILSDIMPLNSCEEMTNAMPTTEEMMLINSEVQRINNEELSRIAQNHIDLILMSLSLHYKKPIESLSSIELTPVELYEMKDTCLWVSDSFIEEVSKLPESDLSEFLEKVKKAKAEANLLGFEFES